MEERNSSGKELKGVVAYAVQTKIGYELNREVSPCVIATNFKEPIAVVAVDCK